MNGKRATRCSWTGSERRPLQEINFKLRKVLILLSWKHARHIQEETHTKKACSKATRVAGIKKNETSG